MKQVPRGTKCMNYFYFADYEILIGDSLRVWGHTTLTYRVDDSLVFDPAEVVARIQQQAADSHGVGRAQVRIRALNRLA